MGVRLLIWYPEKQLLKPHSVVNVLKGGFLSTFFNTYTSSSAFRFHGGVATVVFAIRPSNHSAKSHPRIMSLHSDHKYDGTVAIFSSTNSCNIFLWCAGWSSWRRWRGCRALRGAWSGTYSASGGWRGTRHAHPSFLSPSRDDWLMQTKVSRVLLHFLASVDDVSECYIVVGA